MFHFVKNENFSKYFIKDFIISNMKIMLFQLGSKKIKGLPPLKDKNIFPVCKIHHGLWSFKDSNIGESKAWQMPLSIQEPRRTKK